MSYILHNGVRYDREDFMKLQEKALPVDNEKPLMVDVDGKLKSGDTSGIQGSALVESNEVGVETKPKSRRSKK